ncbi:MAG: DEAD/DEAH box helicase family protein [Legionella sp.]|nr:DEAD/DEAH box helicase family protein [Legionella sp.]
MTKYLVPKDLKDHTKGCPDIAHQELILKKIEELIAGEVFFKKKRFGEKTVYTCDANYGHHYHRLIFERIASSTYVWRAVAWNHDYGKALAWTPFTAEMVSEFKEITSTVVMEEDEAITPFFSYRDSWYELTPLQSKILSCTTFPQLIVGPPGSGKTLSAMALFQEQVLKHQQEGIRLLYLTGAKELKDSVANSWKKWMHHTFGDKVMSHIQVEFLTFAEQFNASLSAGQTLLSHTDAIARIERFIGKNSELSAETIFGEFLIHAPMLMMDASEQKAFAQSRYSKVGINKSSIKPKHWEFLFTLFIRLHKELEARQERVLGISALAPVNEAAQFDLIVVDEAQNNTLADLLNAYMYSKNNRVLFLGDSLQKGSIKVSSLPLLGPILHEALNITLIQHQLPGTHRLRPAVASMAEHLVALYTHLKGGLADSTSYSSLSLNSAPVEKDNSLSWLKHCGEDMQRLGQNAHAAALILTEQDRAEAKKLINGNNVFMVHEAQGLEFSELFLYLSEKTMTSFIAVSQAMQKQGIDADSILVEMTGLSPQKGIVDGPHLELLSMLYVGLSRTYGDAWVYVETLDKQLAHQLKPFLPWLESKCTSNSIKAVPGHLSSKQEWLTVINTFIRQDKLIQAQSNLIEHFGMSAYDASIYAHHQEDALYSTVEQLSHWLQCRKNTSSSASAASKNLEQEQKENVQHSTPLSSSIAASSSASPMQAASVSTNSSPLKNNEAEWVDKFLGSCTKPNNLKALIGQKKAAAMLFQHIMPNGHCLFVNMCLCGFIDDVKDSLVGLFKQPEIKKTCLSLFKTAQNSNDPLLNFTLHAEKDLAKLLQIKSRGAQPKLLGALFNSTLNPLNYLPYVIEKTGRQMTPADMRYQHPADDGTLGPSFLHLLALDASMWSEFFQDIPQEKIKLILKNALATTITTPDRGQGESLLFRLSLLLKDSLWLCNNWRWAVQPFLTVSELFAQPKEGPDKGISIFYRLCSSENGIIVLDWVWDEIKVYLNQERLFTPVTVTEGLFEHTITPFDLLCSNSGGQAFLLQHWDDIKAHIDWDKFFIPTTNSPFFQLGVSKDGMKLLVLHWSDIKTHLTKKQLFAPSSRGETPFYFLCSVTQAHPLLIQHWDYIKAHINWAQLFAPVNDGSLFTNLCSDESTINLLAQHWDDFKAYINWAQIFAQDYDSSPFARLCRNEGGIHLLAQHWDDFKTHLDEELLFTPNTQGISPFFHLCINEDGIKFLDQHWDEIKTDMKWDQFVILENKHKSSFHMLCRRESGRTFLTKHWHEIKAHINWDQFFVRYKDTSLFEKLFINENSIKFLTQHWDDFKVHLIQEQLFSPVPEGRFKGLTLIDLLCETPWSQTLLTQHWDDFKPYVDWNKFFAPMTYEPTKGASSFYWLCTEEQNIKFFSQHWNEFKIHLNRERLFALVTAKGEDHGKSPFYWFCSTPAGRSFMAAYWDSSFSKLVTDEDINKHPCGTLFKELITASSASAGSSSQIHAPGALGFFAESNQEEKTDFIANAPAC